MFKKVQVNTFVAGSSYGSVVKVGTFNADIKVGPQTFTNQIGCFSREVVNLDNIPTITLQGRTFILDVLRFKDAQSADYEVFIPQNLVNDLSYDSCPCCGELILKTGERKVKA